GGVAAEREADGAEVGWEADGLEDAAGAAVALGARRAGRDHDPAALEHVEQGLGGDAPERERQHVVSPRGAVTVFPDLGAGGGGGGAQSWLELLAALGTLAPLGRGD